MKIFLHYISFFEILSLYLPMKPRICMLMAVRRRRGRKMRDDGASGLMY